MNVCHLTSVHPPYDTRILLRECMALKNAGHRVSLIAPADADSEHNGIRIYAVRKQTSRMKRMIFTTYDVLKKSLALDADVYHFHDPELMWVGWWLRRKGKKVVYDVHENVPRQILQKQWLLFPKLVSNIYRVMENLLLPGVNIVTAAASNLDSYAKRFSHCIDIENYPDTDALAEHIVRDRSLNPASAIYIGSVTFDRGIDTMIGATRRLMNDIPEFHFHCIGPVEAAVMEAIHSLPDFSAVKNNVTFHASLPQHKAYGISRGCRVGWCVLKPTPNYLQTFSTKIFEYMAVALPSVASDFEINKPVLEANNAGACIPSDDSKALASATLKMIRDAERSNRMGENGMNAVQRSYNWQAESRKLIEFYRHLI